jgi:xanthine/CO dehydrogenase XdhC/CoxF family maturation factor
LAAGSERVMGRARGGGAVREVLRTKTIGGEREGGCVEEKLMRRTKAVGSHAHPNTRPIPLQHSSA